MTYFLGHIELELVGPSTTYQHLVVLDVIIFLIVKPTYKEIIFQSIRFWRSLGVQPFSIKFHPLGFRKLVVRFNMIILKINSEY